MPKSKAEKRYEAAKVKRRAHIRRGMKIAFYEINQLLRPKGFEIQFTSDFITHTVAIAEGGRRDADPDERIESFVRRIVSRIVL